MCDLLPEELQLRVRPAVLAIGGASRTTACLTSVLIASNGRGHERASLRLPLLLPDGLAGGTEALFRLQTLGARDQPTVPQSVD